MSVLAALQFTKRVEFLASTQTWTVPVGVVQVWATHIGSGGAGGGGTASAANSGNGANGSQIVYRRRLPSTPGDVWTITCPIAATGVNGATGNAGVDSTITVGGLVISRAIGGAAGLFGGSSQLDTPFPQTYGTKVNFNDVLYNIADGQIYPGGIGGSWSHQGNRYDDLPAFQNSSGTADMASIGALTNQSINSVGYQLCGQGTPFGSAGLCANFGNIAGTATGGTRWGAGGGSSWGGGAWSFATGTPANCAATDYGSGGPGAYSAVAGGNGGPGYCLLEY